MRILFIGEQPEAVDFSDPSLPPGMTAEKIHAGLEKAMSDMAERGWQAELCLIQPDDSAPREVEKRLAAASQDGVAHDCVVIGGGIRIPPRSLSLFEAVLNAVHRAAPGAYIAFNTSPENTAAAAERALKATPFATISASR